VKVVPLKHRQVINKENLRNNELSDKANRF